MTPRLSGTPSVPFHATKAMLVTQLRGHRHRSGESMPAGLVCETTDAVAA